MRVHKYEQKHLTPAWLEPPHLPCTEANTQQCVNSSTSQIILCKGTQTGSSPCHSLTQILWWLLNDTFLLILGCFLYAHQDVLGTNLPGSYLGHSPYSVYKSTPCSPGQPSSHIPLPLSPRTSRLLSAVVAQLETWPTTAFTFPSLLVGQCTDAAGTADSLCCV